MSTPTPETALARRWRFQVNMGTVSVPDWQTFPAITEFQWTAEPNIEESTTYDTDGWAENEKTGQAWEVTITFNRKKSADSTVFHPVHEAVRQAFFAYGENNKIHVRFLDRTGAPEAYEGRAIPAWEPSGGEPTALDQTELTLTGTGPLTSIANPVTP
ncbi:phage tail tube protein [Streptomyces sp. NPDC055078]